VARSKLRFDGPSLVSVFTGCGGMDAGFAAAGAHLRVAVERELWACDTLRLNHFDLAILGPPSHSGDIRKVSGVDVLSAGRFGRSRVDILIGGPPCQPFSVAAAQRFLSTDRRFKRRGFGDKVRGTLLWEFLRLVEELRPRVFVLENVPGISTIDGGEQLESFLASIRAAGYKHSAPAVLQAADYGVPQFRERLIVWGSTECDSPTLPPPTHRDPLRPFLAPKCADWITSAQALAGIPAGASNHLPRDHKPESVARYRRLRYGARDRLGRADRLDPWSPSKTVIAGGTKGGGRSHLHPFIARTMTVRESARLQTFPDSFTFSGCTARQFTQVGNAVPPLLAEVIARHITSEVWSMRHTRPPIFAVGAGTPKEAVRMLQREALKFDRGTRYEDFDASRIA
jgi:DNA (cytosine-5)-methyltransferase 1